MFHEKFSFFIFMKNEKTQNTTEKRSVLDFEHRLKVQLTEQHYIDYALTHSEDRIQTGKKRAIFWAILFTVLGVIALYKGSITEGRWSDVYLAAGVLMIMFLRGHMLWN